jgi:2-polyprenyl-3-methyl-5-hydroxy-6-metoxy-1,4-benzoquinol methylase
MEDRQRAALDPEEVAAFAFRVWGYKQGEMVALMVHLGDRLGLYRALEGAGPRSAAELAERTGLHERWLLEWLKAQAAARLLVYHDGDRFELTPVAAAVLADEERSLAFAAGAFTGPPEPDVVDGIADAFRTGIGLPYDRLGPTAAHRTERTLGPWARLALVPVIVPALEEVGAKLRAGATVADVGCGAGVALRALAEAFPESRFHGYDPSRHAIERAQANMRAAGLANVELHREGAEALPADPTFDLVLTFDCLHDMTDPEEAAAAIRRAVPDDGTWLVKDIRSAPGFTDNLRNPLLAMFYAFSVTTCLSSSLAEPGGAGLGTLGLPPPAVERLSRGAGFTRFRQHDFDDPANLYYEIRP